MVRIGDGLVHLCVVVDVCSRCLLDYRLSSTGAATLCCATMQDALSRYGQPQVFLSDKGSIYTAGKFQAWRRRNHIAASMTGASRWKALRGADVRHHQGRMHLAAGV